MVAAEVRFTLSYATTAPVMLMAWNYAPAPGSCPWLCTHRCLTCCLFKPLLLQAAATAAVAMVAVAMAAVTAGAGAAGAGERRCSAFVTLI